MTMRAAIILAAALLAGCATTAEDDFLMPAGLTCARLEQALAAAAAHPLGSLENPVRADMPPGQHRYLESLRCSNGEPPEFEREGNMGPGPFGGIVDKYRVACPRGQPREAAIYMDMYHPGHVETRPVPGFTRAGLPQA